MAEEVKAPKKSLSPRQVFWMRMGFWALFACILPVSFIVWRFDLFSKKPSIGGWGIVVIIIVAVFVLSLIKYVKAGMKFSLVKQVINGVCKVIIPLLVAVLMLECLKNEIDLAIQVLTITITCECIAIPLNPLPQWAYDNRNEEIESIFDIMWSRKKKDEE